MCHFLQTFAPVVLLALLLSHGGPVRAGEREETPSDRGESQPAKVAEPAAADAELVFPIPTVVVTAKRIDAPPTQVTRVVGQEDFAAWNAVNMADALTYTPGVNVLVGGTSGDASPWIRGFRDRDLLVLFDGIPIGDSLEGAVDLNDFALQRVASVRVMKSAPSVIYGANGVGGVIEIVPDLAVPPGLFLDGRLELGSDERRLLLAEGGLGAERVRLLASAQHQEAGNYSLSGDYRPAPNQPAGRRVNSDYDRDSLILYLSAPDSPLGNTGLFYNLAESESGLPVDAGAPDPDYERSLLSRRQTLGFSNQLPELPLAVKLHYNRYDSELGIYSGPDYVGPEEIEVAQDTSFGGKLYSTIERWQSNTLVLMAAFQQDRYEAEGQLEETNGAETLTYSLAVEDQYWINRRLSAAAGGILTRFNQKRLDTSSTEFNPQVALAWRATDRLDLHASVAERTRYPKLRELYRRRYGNPALEPQTALNTEIGLSFRHGAGLTTDFSFYHSKVEDLIERLDRRSLYQNLDEVTFRGFEAASGGWLWGSDFLRVSWSYLDANESVPGAGSRQLRSRPRNTVTLEYRHSFDDGFEFAFNAIHVRGLYDLDPDDVYTEIDPYFVANVKLSRPISERSSAYLAVENLLDEDYQHRLGFPREGRSFRMGLTLRL